jgi:carboxypeptidase C (cathepsin A)
VSGESYGGVYVPYLSYQIFVWNNATGRAEEDKIPLKGFMVGNGATNWDFDVGPSYPQTLYNFNMISKKVYDKY